MSGLQQQRFYNQSSLRNGRSASGTGGRRLDFQHQFPRFPQPTSTSLSVVAAAAADNGTAVATSPPLRPQTSEAAYQQQALRGSPSIGARGTSGYSPGMDLYDIDLHDTLMSDGADGENSSLELPGSNGMYHYYNNTLS